MPAVEQSRLLYAWRRAGILGCLALSISLLLSGCNREFAKEVRLPERLPELSINIELNSTTLRHDDTTTVESYTSTAGSAEGSAPTTTAALVSSTASAGTTPEPVVPKIQGSFDVRVDDAQVMQNETARQAIVQAIADAHEVGFDDVQATFDDTPTNSSFRRLARLWRVSYIIRVLLTAPPAVVEKVIEVAKQVTKQLMNTMVSKRMRQFLRVVAEVIIFNEPVTITTTTTTAATTSATAASVSAATTYTGTTTAGTTTTHAETTTASATAATTSATAASASSTTTYTGTTTAGTAATTAGTTATMTTYAGTMTAIATAATTSNIGTTTAGTATTSGTTSTYSGMTAAAATTSMTTATLYAGTATTSVATATTGAIAASSAAAGESTTTSTSTSTTSSTSTSTSSTSTSTTPRPTTTTTTTTTTREPSYDAQFLIQASFGPSRASMAELKSKHSLESWIDDQTALPYTSQRAYFRHRVNQRQVDPMVIASPRAICKAGSRYQNMVFDQVDIGKTVTVSGNGLFVDGEFRTNLDTVAPYTGNDVTYPTQACTDVYDSNDCTTMNWNCNKNGNLAHNLYCTYSCFHRSEQHAYPGTDCTLAWQDVQPSDSLKICEVDEKIGGIVRVGLTDCSNSFKNGVMQYRVYRNIAFWFPDLASHGVAVTSLPFTPMMWNPAVMILATTGPYDSACGLAAKIQMQDTQKFYVHSPRSELLENTLTNPNTWMDFPQGTYDYPGRPTLCPTVARNHINAASCKLASVCTPTQFKKSRIHLTAANYKKFYDVGTKYVYEISGLRVSTTPCGVTSRWRLMDCGSESCVASTFSDANDLNMIHDALGYTVGWLRDIFVSCSLSIPAGRIVQVNTEYFKHVHHQEHNVYDFTDWAEPFSNSGHPGGQAQIKQFSDESLGTYKLGFPSNHDMNRWEAGTTQNTIHYVGKANDTIEYNDLPSGLQSAELSEAFEATSSVAAYFQTCGSPDEVGNDPVKGNQFHLWTWFGGGSDRQFDDVFDTPLKYIGLSDPDQSVWFTIAFEAEDQLRQRMAWALSQILVTASGTIYHEGKMSFYDIFTRNAFGNFRNILREVAWHKVMGGYLTYEGSSSYDNNGNYPDENYAREIMQLFTIGLFQLNDDGTKKMNNGDTIPTYDNTHIMTFSKIFTGFANQHFRGNVEMLKGSKNSVDFMRMRASYHDKYPKTDLDRNYIGDGYPLCVDQADQAFLKEGAKYEYMGNHYDGGNFVKVLSSNSALYQTLCAAASGSCVPRLYVTLGSDLTCYDAECEVDTVKVVQVGSGYYEYIPPTCVKLYFFGDGKHRVPGRRNWFYTTTKWECADTNYWNAGISCCDNSDQNSNPESRICRYPRELVKYAKAQAACAAQGLQLCSKRIGQSAIDASTCDHDEYGWIWKPDLTNWYTTDTSDGWCTQSIAVDDSGFVADQDTTTTKGNWWEVKWTSGFPTKDNCPSGCTADSISCVCPVTVSTAVEFTSLPSKAQVLESLKIGAFKPTVACSTCAGEVLVYENGGSFNENTVFEVEGRYYKNVVSTVAAGGFEFRNPPAFIVQRDEPREYEAIAEVEALLDHLFEHDNTPVFICYRLIQRFGNSNPSPSYVTDCVQAFKTGTYAGRTFSGQRGDLEATIHAILLHADARSPAPGIGGSLREPVVKIMHFLRAMEYVENTPKPLYMHRIEDEVGQAPYKSPSVFNFYYPDYQPSSFSSGTYVAPEFQILTTPLAITTINGMMGLGRYGISQCDDGFGMTDTSVCSAGTFGVGELSTADETLDQLDLLLTGSRLGAAKNDIKEVYDADGFTAALRGIMLSAEFNTIGVPDFTQYRNVVPPPELSTPPDYKAMVMVMLSGGADTFNMIVPRGDTLYNEYKSVRSDIALETFQLDDINTTGQNLVCDTCNYPFGVHYKLPFFTSLYNSGELAFLVDVGALAMPTSKATYKTDPHRCIGLYSHSDQQVTAATIKCDTLGKGPKGLGGRIADVLTASGKNAASFSIDGHATFAEGVDTRQKILSGSGGFNLQRGVKWFSHSSNRTTIELLMKTTDREYGNIYAEEYSLSMQQSLNNSEFLGDVLDNAVLSGTSNLASLGDAGGDLGGQLLQVAKLISARADRKAERDIFYVNLGGFDHHSDAADGLKYNFEWLNAAIESFVTEMKGQNIWDNVVMLSSSDFGRTLTTNGAGTDHAWSGHYFVLGGKVNGQKVYNQYPSSLLEGNDQDAGRARFIPKYPWENMLHPIVDWMGVDAADMSTVLPNIARFNMTRDIIATSELFDLTS